MGGPRVSYVRQGRGNECHVCEEVGGLCVTCMKKYVLATTVVCEGRGVGAMWLSYDGSFTAISQS